MTPNERGAGNVASALMFQLGPTDCAISDTVRWANARSCHPSGERTNYGNLGRR